MVQFNIRRITRLATVWSFALIPLAAIAAESVKVEGLIKARDGNTMILQTKDSPKLVVQLTDDTKVGQVQGMLKARRKEMSMAALIPGLAVKVEGTYDNQNQLLAKSVSFKGNDLKRAESIQAGLHETKEQTKQNKAELEKQQQQVSANKAAIDAAVARFGQLDDYYILDEVTVYFANGKVKIDPKYAPQLMALAQKAKNVNGYMIEVKGYASAVGSTELNQKLSEDRANEVTNILIQQGNIPLTRMLAPGAMGESHQVGGNQTEKEQAGNRRVVVRVLQNKAIAGV
ncbi:MAG TPA: OmpA family protein [Terriglobales bacterium]|jgi:OOP family OmpA-OmpF porin|nr:OmpA family protein [Terriglobales bacterium]